MILLSTMVSMFTKGVGLALGAYLFWKKRT